MKQYDELEYIDTIENACSHEHWGSLHSIGIEDGGYRADNIAGASSPRTTVFDLLFDPYLNDTLTASGFDTDTLAAENGFPDIHAMAENRPGDILAAALPHLENLRSGGIMRCLASGLRALYDFDLDGLAPDNIEEIDSAINVNYRNPFAWYRKAMKRCSLGGLIRPVALSFLYEDAEVSMAEEERSFTSAVLRIDDFVEALPVPNGRMRYCIERTGIEPVDAGSWRRFLEAVFASAREAGCKGIKQLQAYNRDLRFSEPPENTIAFGTAEEAALRPFQDFVVHECCKLADDLGWPFQIHVGTDNLPASNPLALEPLFRSYGRTRFVLLHCWPYLAESAYLARFHPNVFLDTCWLPLLNPAFTSEAFRTYIGYVPSHKIMASQDATSVEMACGASRMTKNALKTILGEKIEEGAFSLDESYRLANRILHRNAVELYDLEGS